MTQNLLFDYLDIFNEVLLKLKLIRKIIFSYKVKEDISLITFIYQNNFKEKNIAKTELKKVKQGNKNFILLEKEDILNKEALNDKLKTFIFSCLKLEPFSIKDLYNIYKDINDNSNKSKEKIDNNNNNNIYFYNENNNEEYKRYGYVGLTNLGATCYMNSILQQLFMIYPFRYAILGTNQNLNNDSFMKELQILYSNLELNLKHSYEPDNFCKALNIDVRIQEDSQQFYISLCDNVEKGLKSLNKAKYL